MRLMDSTSATPECELNSNEGNKHVKLLCSFSGTILPRPQDGKLRYVGGETRIVSVPRDIKYAELMRKMRDLSEGVVALRYQQPDGDLDAIVSVVDDDDVTNMMEEYDKSGSRDGFTRLRLFLFGHPEQDGFTHFGDGDESDNEKRYMDALNSLNESPDFRKLTGQLQHLVAQKYNEMEAPWSPAYYSPRHSGSIDQRQASEYSSSPSSSRYQRPYGEFSERGYDRMHYNQPSINFHPFYEHHPLYSDNFLVVHASTVNEIAGFPGNILQGPNSYEANNVCDHCRMAFQRSPVYPDSSLKPNDQPHVESSNAGSGYLHAPDSCAECSPSRESYFLNLDGNLPSPYYRDQNDHRFMYPEVPGNERGWVSPIQPNPWPEEPIRHLSITGRLPDCYSMENGTSVPLGHGNARDGHHGQSHYLLPDDQHYALTGVDYGNQVNQDQVGASGRQVHLPSVEGQGLHYGNPAYLYQMPHGNIPSPTIWRNAHSPLPGAPSYDTSVSTQIVRGPVPMGNIQSAVEVSPRVRNLENQSNRADAPDYSHVRGRFAPNTPEHHHPQQAEPIQSAYFPVRPSISQSQPKCVPALSADDKFPILTAPDGGSRNGNGSTRSVLVNVNHAYEGSGETSNDIDSRSCFVSGTNEQNSDVLAPTELIKSNVPEASVENGGALEVCEANPIILDKQPDDKLEILPELISSVKEETFQYLKEVKDNAQKIDLDSEQKDAAVENTQIHKDGVDRNIDLKLDNDNDVKTSKIELTKAEAEALERGLQTINNEDLEEIRELGSGTYGAVYHGKWKGSDVAIKRIKASCFAGKPSERERLIADFWNEALTLSSLHHPNVVSFYGVVRDGPDGSLATVTEFMVNGSLKQFLQKKDRTIDRRKRLIIAMDTAFGMEYLHGKNIVHFDLKCENLLVNMRDPHRPVCKIGDLGLSKVKHHSLVSGGVRGTLPWMAPELLTGKTNMVTEKIDVYSFGIVMWELLTGDEPYGNRHCASIIGGIVNNTLRPQIPSWCDPQWKSLMESCWAADPAQRPSFTEISQRLRTMAAAMNLK